MTRLLHISSSPRGGASESLAIAGAFLEGYRETHPDAEVDTFDLWDGSLPEFGPPRPPRRRQDLQPTNTAGGDPAEHHPPEGGPS